MFSIEIQPQALRSLLLIGMMTEFRESLDILREVYQVSRHNHWNVVPFMSGVDKVSEDQSVFNILVFNVSQ